MATLPPGDDPTDDVCEDLPGEVSNRVGAFFTAVSKDTGSRNWYPPIRRPEAHDARSNPGLDFRRQHPLHVSAR
jgi:hypothetical protein